eukprot:3731472-Pyramimonas_sp.AAC.1
MCREQPPVLHALSEILECDVQPLPARLRQQDNFCGDYSILQCRVAQIDDSAVRYVHMAAQFRAQQGAVGRELESARHLQFLEA